MLPGKAVVRTPDMATTAPLDGGGGDVMRVESFTFSGQLPKTQCATFRRVCGGYGLFVISQNFYGPKRKPETGVKSS